MDIYTIHAQTFLDWLLHSTCQASLFICLVLLVQRVLRNQLNIRARYLMWLILVVHMALPWAPQSHLSVYNLLPHAPAQGYKVHKGPGTEGGSMYFTVEDEIAAIKSQDSAGAASATRMRLFADSKSKDRIVICLSLFWLVGAGFLTVWILACNMRILRVIRRTCPVTNPEILELLDDCRQQMGTHRSVRVIATDLVCGPALFGLVRPYLLLPDRVLVDMDRNELRYIFLHELAHLRRYDIFFGMVTSVLHILHWFNPLVGYGLRRMRADQELACDGLALSRLNTHEAAAYGHTVLRLIEQLLKSRSRFMLTGFLGGRARIKQRLAMISRFTKETYRYSPLAIVIIGILGYIGLTDRLNTEQIAHARPKEVRSTVPRALPVASDTVDEYPNVQRIYIRHLETGQYLIASGNIVDCDSKPGEAGLWEARWFDGSISLGHGGDVLLYSVSESKYLKSDEQGNLTLSQLAPDVWAYWIVHANPLGVQVISQEFESGYLRMEEQGQVKAVTFGRDLRSQWDIIQLDRDEETKDNVNK